MDYTIQSPPKQAVRRADRTGAEGTPSSRFSLPSPRLKDIHPRHMASDETVVKRSSFLCIFCYFFAAAAILLSAFATCARFTLPVGLNAFLLSPCIRWFLMQNETDEMAQFWMLRLSLNS